MTDFKSPYKQLNRKINTWCIYTKRLDTYGCGCQHNCDYCYAKSLLSFRGFWNANEPATANIKKIRSDIKKLSGGDVVRIGGMTDCFQPIEKQMRVTYNTIKVLNKYKLNYLIVTKSDLVASPEYIEIYDKDLAHFQVTVTSTEVNNYEKAPEPGKRIKAIEKLQSHGFDVSLRLSPYLPEKVDLKVINNIECNKVLIEFLKVNYNVKKWFDTDYSKYSLKFGGFSHLELNNKIDLTNMITGFKQKSVGEYVYSHYMYFRDNVNFNRDDCCNLTLKPYVNPQLKLFFDE
jgi:DNA repair photolyase